MKKYLILLFIFNLIFSGVISISTAQAERIDNLRLWKAPDNTRLVFDLQSRIPYHFFILNNPHRAVIDLTIATNKQAILQFKNSANQLNLEGGVIKKVRSSVQKNGQYRIVFDLSEPVRPVHFQLPPNSQYGHRLVIDFKKESQYNHQEKSDPILAILNQAPIPNRPKTPTPTAQFKMTEREVIIALDAGHGGEDPGAKGPTGTLEKNIVLRVAKKLEQSINQEPGMRAVLIRSGDYYIDLSKRRNIAKEKYNADFFISLHADAWHQKSANGASVFILSHNGATSTRARHLAEKENAADLIGGVVSPNQDPVLKKVLVDLAMEGSMEHSLTAGNQVLREMGKIAHLHKSEVEKAGFAVLKTAQMPGMLVELGFITNPKEERLLKSHKHQQKLATAIFRGVQNYFTQQPPPDTYFAALRQRGIIQHKIIRGETLSEIAARYKVPEKRIKEANSLNSNLIRIGKVLKIPN